AGLIDMTPAPGGPAGPPLRPKVALPIPRNFPPPPPIDTDTLCADSRAGDAVDLDSGAGDNGAIGGGVQMALCVYTYTTPALPLECGSSIRGATGPNGPDGTPTPVDWRNHIDAKWTRLAWAIAMHRILPLEIARRLAVAHQRSRAGEI